MSALAVLTVVESAIPNATFFSGLAQSFGVPWVALTVTFNVVVTSFICGRLFISYLSMKRLGVDSQATERWGVIAILIESALPFSILGLIYAVFNGLGSPLAVLFGDVWGNIVVSDSLVDPPTRDRSTLLQGLAPQLIILRVAMGRAWTRNTIASGISPMQFREAGSATRVLSDTIGAGANVKEKPYAQSFGDEASETV